MRFLTTLRHPARYHGHGRPPPFFEGWYYKLVDVRENHRLAIIPAIFKSDRPERHHAFIQVLDGLTGESSYHRYPAQTFWSASDRFAVDIAGSRFSGRGLAVDIDDEAGRLQGQIRFGPLTPWPVSWLSPGVMGPFAYAPFMECRHGVLSFNHTLTGRLQYNDRTLDFSGGRGYLEKDWGRSFPAGYIWMQTNHFDQPDTSFFGSIAIIPWFNTSFAGFISGLHRDGRLYPFATYTGARPVHLQIDDRQVEWVMRGPRHQIEIFARRGQSGLLYGPNRQDMSERVGETMRGTIDIRLSSLNRQKPARLLFEGRGYCAGLELHGDTGQLLALQKKLIP